MVVLNELELMISDIV